MKQALPSSEDVAPVSAAGSDYRARLRLLDRFFEFGLHARLLTFLRGSTEEEEWASLEKLVHSWPHENPDDLNGIFRPGWRRWWETPPEP